MRLPRDILLVASADPEAYTNRGRVISPLKDRFGSQIRTHYPLDLTTEVEVIRQEAVPFDAGGVHVEMPGFMVDVVGTISQLAWVSPHVTSGQGSRCG